MQISQSWLAQTYPIPQEHHVPLKQPFSFKLALKMDLQGWNRDHSRRPDPCPTFLQMQVKDDYSSTSYLICIHRISSQPILTKILGEYKGGDFMLSASPGPVRQTT